MLYAISARVTCTTGDDTPTTWTKTVELPTFYLDANVQGIVSEGHAIEIVRDMLQRLGHSRQDINVQACATNRPIFEAVRAHERDCKHGTPFGIPCSPCEDRRVDDDKFGAI